MASSTGGDYRGDAHAPPSRLPVVQTSACGQAGSGRTSLGGAAALTLDRTNPRHLLDRPPVPSLLVPPWPTCGSPVSVAERRCDVKTDTRTRARATTQS